MSFDPSSLIANCVAIDLEVGSRDHRIHAFGAVDGASQEAVNYQGTADLHGQLAKLDAFTARAKFIVGHNFLAHDRVYLIAANSSLNLLALPVIDTLRLNPLAFPRNPYHHLVKHYQNGRLLGGRVNDPVNDARLTLELLRDQLLSFEKVKTHSPELLLALHWLTTRDEGAAGYSTLFSEVRMEQTPSDAVAIRAIRSLLQENTCSTQLAEILSDAVALTLHVWPLAYVLAWLSVAGGDSVMAPWVIHQFPQAGKLARRLRDQPCNKISCHWCSEHYDSRRQLERRFGFKAFRAEPADSNGRPLQQAIVEALMNGRHVLGILPTGTGKSVCYQLPALARYERTGALTVVISPLVALMADQVAGLERLGITSGATINGLLSMPERAEVLDRVRLGGVGILLVSPEQLRSRSVRRVLEQREVGGWVIDEAHCISKWGHDFRPDYRYIARYIREKSTREQRDDIAPVMCLTATAKPDVVNDIVSYFHDKLGVDLDVSNGGAQRSNLNFLVVPTSTATKTAHLHQVLDEQFRRDADGGAIVYCAKRRSTEEIAQYLSDKGISADYFHAGLKADARKDVQQRFIDGELKVIVATNAFGMGIDKPDVRLVIHADVPGSLENYMQEAGRAGRDRRAAACVLFYTPEDIEQQFMLSARSRLTRSEIHAILRSLRSLEHKKNRAGEVIATTGEILSEDEAIDFERDRATDDTRVKTAVAWLEEAHLLRREENVVTVFPSSLRAATLTEAEKKLREAEMTPAYRNQLLSVVRRLFAADPDEGVSTDELGVSHEKLPRAMSDLERLGILSNDTVITAYVHAGTERSSRKRFDEADNLEKSLIDLLRSESPEVNSIEPAHLNLRRVTQRLKDDGNVNVLDERVTRLLRSLAGDGRDEGGRGSLKFRGVDRENLLVWVQREWQALSETARRRRLASGVLLKHLLQSLPVGKRGSNLLAQSTLGRLQAALSADVEVMSLAKDPPALLRRALLWLHEQNVIQLNKGLAVFRSAMTIHLSQDKRGFLKADFEPLKLHYDQQVIQIHVMAEFVTRGLHAMAEALALAMDYFSVTSDEFINRWLDDRRSQLDLQTTPESWNRIVASLNNSVQEHIVTDDREQSNVLVLAGPGSGKTRVLVHRIAYLVRVRREDPRGILALAYNRHAAVEIRKRLKSLIGRDAIGITVMTCHSFAMRLAGVSLERRKEMVDDNFFKKVMQSATALLKGERVESNDDDEDEDTDRQRDELLRGFRWILVDEYQDVGPEQYELIAAIAGRSEKDDDRKLSLFAVGDDDQNIYSFRGASVEFIRRFENDYSAKPAFLVENYRSTGNIIDAANLIIDGARTRMKMDHPIAIDRGRRSLRPGGEWEQLDPIARGRVQILSAGRTTITQAMIVMAELERLSRLDPQWNWSSVAVIAREWKTLDPVRTFCELKGIPFQMADEDNPNLWRLRETRQLITTLRSHTGEMKLDAIRSWIDSQSGNQWWGLLSEAVEAWESENEGREFVTRDFEEWLVEWGRELRRRQKGLLLLSAHRAKGLEFDHVAVLDGSWDRAGQGDDSDAQRRLYYVAMTRARKTLLLAQYQSTGGSSSFRRNPMLNGLERSPALTRRQVEPDSGLEVSMFREYRTLSLKDVYLDFAGSHRQDHEIHRAIARLNTGSPLQLKRNGSNWEVADVDGVTVSRLAKSCELPEHLNLVSARVNAIVSRRKEDSDEEFRERLRCDSWEIVLPELVFGAKT